MNDMTLYDSKHRHEVAKIIGDEIVSRHGHSFRIEGYAVVDQDGEIVGTIDEGKFHNVFGELMAVSGAAIS